MLLRVYVTNIINDNEVSVYFCDFGDVTIVSRYCLQPLKSDFLKLPYQAVKAKLVGKRNTYLSLFPLRNLFFFSLFDIDCLPSAKDLNACPSVGIV